MIGLLSSSNDQVYFIDELDRRLHPLMTHNIVDIFLQNSADKYSQLIVTTHESRLLDRDLLRNDEVWLMEKNRENASTLYSLEEFKLSPNADIERGYLGGRYGAIPILPGYNRLAWTKNQNGEAQVKSETA